MLWIFWDISVKFVFLLNEMLLLILVEKLESAMLIERLMCAYERLNQTFQDFLWTKISHAKKFILKVYV